MMDGKFLRQTCFPIFFQRDINEPTIKKSAKSAVFLMHFLWLLYVTNSQVRVKDKTKKIQ